MAEQKCLRFENQEEWYALKQQCGWPRLGAPDTAFIHEIGIIYEDAVQTGTDADGIPLFAPMVPKSGWHVNVVMFANRPLPEVLDPYRIIPQKASFVVMGCEP